MKSHKKKFATRFWQLEYVDSEGNSMTRLAQGPKHYKASAVKKYLKLACPEMQIKSGKRGKRPEWAVIFQIQEEV